MKIPFSICLLDALEKNVSPRMYQQIVCEACEYSEALNSYKELLESGEFLEDNEERGDDN